MKNEMPNHYTKNGIEYRRVGDYYFPVLLEPAEQPDIGKWGLMRKDYLDRNQPELISHLLFNWSVIRLSFLPQRAGTGSI